MVQHKCSVGFADALREASSGARVALVSYASTSCAHIRWVFQFTAGASGDHALELGTRESLARLAAREGHHVSAIDFSEKMVERMRAKHGDGLQHMQMPAHLTVGRR